LRLTIKPKQVYRNAGPYLKPLWPVCVWGEPVGGELGQIIELRYRTEILSLKKNKTFQILIEKSFDSCCSTTNQQSITFSDNRIFLLFKLTKTIFLLSRWQFYQHLMRSFLYKSVLRTFYGLTVWICNFFQKKISTNAVRYVSPNSHTIFLHTILR